jgi:hypothetical protein
MSLALYRCAFPRGLALRLPGVPLSPNLPTRTLLSARYHPPPALGPVNTKRRRHPIVPAALALDAHSTLQFHINFVLIVLPHIGWATSTTSHSTASDPAEEEALLCLEQGTQRLEEGDVEGAKNLYQRSVHIKRNASSLFNLGVTHYHLSSYSFSKTGRPYSKLKPLQEEFDAAVHSWTSAIELQPSSADAHTSSFVVSYFDCLCSTALFRVQTWRAHT